MNQVLLLDTDIVSFFLKRDTRSLLYAPLLQGQRLSISFMTVAELYQWARVRKWGKQRMTDLEDKLQSYLVFPFDQILCRLWADVRIQCQTQGRTISAQDAWIAATAIQYELPLVTHNSDDFRSVEGLRIMTVRAPSSTN